MNRSLVMRALLLPKKAVGFFHTNSGLQLQAKVPVKVINNSWKSAKDKFLNMDLEEKRGYYHVKGNYLELERIRPWPVYYQHMKLARTRQKKRFPVKFPVNNLVSVGRANLVGVEIDAIVNSTTQNMTGNGGDLDKLIHASAGPELAQECASLHGCDVGEAKMTGGYRLPAKYVIHTVGPSNENAAQLKACYVSCLNLMEIKGLRTIGFPCISTTSNQFPSEAAAHIALNTIRLFLERNVDNGNVERVCIGIHRHEDLHVYWDLMQVYFPVE